MPPESGNPNDPMRILTYETWPTRKNLPSSPPPPATEDEAGEAGTAAAPDVPEQSSEARYPPSTPPPDASSQSAGKTQSLSAPTPLPASRLPDTSPAAKSAGSTREQPSPASDLQRSNSDLYGSRDYEIGCVTPIESPKLPMLARSSSPAKAPPKTTTGVTRFETTYSSSLDTVMTEGSLSLRNCKPVNGVQPVRWPRKRDIPTAKQAEERKAARMEKKRKEKEERAEREAKGKQ